MCRPVYGFSCVYVYFVCVLTVSDVQTCVLLADTRELSMRETGLVIQVVLLYSNMNSHMNPHVTGGDYENTLWNCFGYCGTSETIQYQYKPYRMLETEYEVLEVLTE